MSTKLHSTQNYIMTNSVVAPNSTQNTTKKQRSLHDFFEHQSTKSKINRRKRPNKNPDVEEGPVKKKIEHDTSSSGVMDDSDFHRESSDGNSASQSSDVSFTLPKPKRIDFSMCCSQKSEPDLEPPELTETFHFRRADSQLSNSLDIPMSSIPPSFSRMYSQDDIDFLTPQDQPVRHLSHPTTPSPLKKRHRLSPSAGLMYKDDVQNLTQDMIQMDVCATAEHTPASKGKDAFDSRFSQASPIRHSPHPLLVRPHSAGNKRVERVRTAAVTASVAAFPVVESFNNPFASLGAVVNRKKDTNRRKRHTLPPSFRPDPNASQYSKYLKDFVEEELIGSGSFSKVYKCQKKIDGWMYAVKKSRRHFRGKTDAERALREVQALAALSDTQHIVQYFDAWIEEDLLYIQLEYCQGCNLNYFLDKVKPNPIHEQTLCKVLCHIAMALRDMHSRKMVHLDVKLQNVLVSTNGEIYKLGDLGTVAHLDDSSEITEGDNRYLSRELLEGSRSNLKAGDIFALGAMIYEMALGNVLPSGGEEWQKIRDGDLVMFRQYSNSLQHLIVSMMHPDPLQRPSAEEVLQHETLTPYL